MEAVGKIPVQPWMRAPATVRVLDALAASGSAARFVGGCVRDAILEREVRDIDIALGVPPEEVMRVLSAAAITVIPTGIAHGTVTAVVDGHHFEITSLRADVETFGRHAKVAFVDDWMADAARRDFTINAMFAAADGALYDPFGGMADVKAGRVRFVGDAAIRIREDVLRLLRFFRFYAHYGRTEPDTAALAACTQLAHLLPTLSGERVAGEVLRLLAAPAPAEIVQLMADHRVLRHVLPEASAIAGLRALVTIEAELGMVDALRRLGAVLTVGAAGAADVAQRLRLSNRQSERLSAICVTPLASPCPPRAQRRQALYRWGNRGYRDWALINWATSRMIEDAERGDAAWREALSLADEWTPPRFPLRGADVMTRGVAAGPEVGELLRAVETWWVDGDFAADRQACLAELDRRLAAIRS